VGVITLARVHDVRDDVTEGARPRYLVDRLWPRGVRRDRLHLTGWIPEVGPSHELRRWFGHDPSRWEEFRRRYAAELDERPSAWAGLADAVAAGDVVLLYSSRDAEHNNAVALRDYLLARTGTDPAGTGAGGEDRGG
jgi:uncharacterized protein YeaO (DUF488 family)